MCHNQVNDSGCTELVNKSLNQNWSGPAGVSEEWRRGGRSSTGTLPLTELGRLVRSSSERVSSRWTNISLLGSLFILSFIKQTLEIVFAIILISGKSTRIRLYRYYSVIHIILSFIILSFIFNILERSATFPFAREEQSRLQQFCYVLQ